MTEFADSAKAGAKAATWVGIAVLLLGMLAIGMPFLTGVAITISIGVILLITGIAQLFFAFNSHSFGSGALRFGFGILSGLCGLSLVTQPGAGLATITLFLAVWFVVDGVFTVVNGISWRPQSGWGLMVGSGVIGVLLGVMIYSQFPTSSVWLVGLLVGIRLLLVGWTMIALGAVGRQVAKEIDTANV
ncbi:HdeD family acid-resistance protein [Halioglobus pacificus]|nr:HdeD family acid-resistance protein [Halioglobus pacificus]